MKYLLLSLSCLLPLTTSASRIETNSFTIRTAEDAIAEGKLPCAKITHTLSPVLSDNDVSAEYSNCFFTKADVSTIKLYFVKFLGTRTNQRITSQTFLNHDLYLSPQILNLAMVDVAEKLKAQGCGFSLNLNWGFKAYSSLHLKTFVGDLIPEVLDVVRCQ
jgi:hypothetical protein